jgi:preprotein translocase subunit SecF
MMIGTYSTIFIAAPMYAHLRAGEEAIKKQAKRVQQARAAASVASVTS